MTKYCRTGLAKSNPQEGHLPKGLTYIKGGAELIRAPIVTNEDELFYSWGGDPSNIPDQVAKFENNILVAANIYSISRVLSNSLLYCITEIIQVTGNHTFVSPAHLTDV
jgi:hypothetical protein